MTLAFITIVTLMVMGAWYTNHVQRESDRRWCELVSTLDDAYVKTPPVTPWGHTVADDMHKLRIELHC